MIVCCASCQSKFRIDPARLHSQVARIRCPKCKGIIAVGAPPAGPVAVAAGAGDWRAPAARVVVAHGSAAFCQTLAGFLRREGFAVEVASEGNAALALVREIRPEIVLVDVALPGIVGHTLCEQVKGDPELAHAKVILIGAIYDRGRYRREPQSLYGADDYVEKHRMPDDLVQKIRRLLDGGASQAGAAEPGRLDGERAGAAPARPDRGSSLEAMIGAPAKAEDEQARRLARIIVSDIVLYNPEAVQRGLKERNLADLVKDEISEGRNLLRARVGAAVAGARDYVLEALDEYVRRQGAARKTVESPR